MTFPVVNAKNSTISKNINYEMVKLEANFQCKQKKCKCKLSIKLCLFTDLMEGRKGKEEVIY